MNSRLPSSLNRATFQTTRLVAALLIGLVAVNLVGVARAAVKAEVLENRKIWDQGAHNAFTDLIHWKDRWWCTFREAEDHVGGDGTIRVITSVDGVKWESAANLAEKDIDLRDPKLTVTPDGRLMLNCGGSVYLGTKVLKGKQSRALFSSDGRNWTAPQRILKEGEWLWRVTWHDGVAYGAVYRSIGQSSVPGAEWQLAVYRSKDGLAWEVVKEMDVTGRPNEMTLRFEPNGEMVALVRREAGNTMGFIGRAAAPYTQWTWKESNHRFGGQNAVRLPGGAWLVGTRDYTNSKQGKNTGATTILAELAADGRLAPLVTFPSGGDTSYPGMVWRNDVLWFSYYSSHEGKTSIYLAKVKITP